MVKVPCGAFKKAAYFFCISYMAQMVIAAMAIMPAPTKNMMANPISYFSSLVNLYMPHNRYARMEKKKIIPKMITYKPICKLQLPLTCFGIQNSEAAGHHRCEICQLFSFSGMHRMLLDKIIAEQPGPGAGVFLATAAWRPVKRSSLQ